MAPAAATAAAVVPLAPNWHKRGTLAKEGLSQLTAAQIHRSFCSFPGIWLELCEHQLRRVCVLL